MTSKSMKSLTLAALLASAGLVFAAPPEGAGQAGAGKSRPDAQAKPEVPIGAYFQDRQRQAVLQYYGSQQAKGRCPPGLAKKNNGCMPPGQAKKWSVGQPLPGTLTYYPVPRSVISQIGLPPDGYKYVRVANDLLLVAIGTMMVVDAIEDLMRP